MKFKAKQIVKLKLFSFDIPLFYRYLLNAL